MKKIEIPIVTFNGNGSGSPFSGIYYGDYLETSVGLAWKLINDEKEWCQVIFTISDDDELLCAQMVRGGYGQAELYIQDILRTSIASYASASSSVLVVCKKPLNDIRPDADDIRFVNRCVKALRYMDMRFSDYIILGDEGSCFSLSMNGMLPNLERVNQELGRMCEVLGSKMNIPTHTKK